MPAPLNFPLSAEEIATLRLHFAEHTQRDDLTGCLRWTGALTGETSDGRGGYPEIGLDSERIYYAHRVSFLLEHGRWPSGPLHHACTCRQCVDSSHLIEIGSHHTHMALHAAMRHLNQTATPAA